MPEKDRSTSEYHAKSEERAVTEAGNLGWAGHVRDRFQPFEQGRPLAAADPQSSDVVQLRKMAAAWNPGNSDQHSNRQFLAVFAVYLVKHFRSEEARLERLKAPDRKWKQVEHRHLVQQLADLMASLDLDLEVTSGIQAFLAEWRFHQDAMEAFGL